MIRTEPEPEAQAMAVSARASQLLMPGAWPPGLSAGLGSFAVTPRDEGDQDSGVPRAMASPFSPLVS